MSFFLKKINGNLKQPLFLAIAMMVAWFFFFGHKYQFIYNHGSSMEPTIQDSEWLVVQKAGKWKPSRFDVVIVKTDGEKLVKRIMATEGENVTIKNGKLYINGKELKEPYSKGDVTYWLEPEEERATKPKKEWLFFNVDENIGLIPKGYVFVIGDNRELTWYGVVKEEGIQALVIF